MWARETGNRVFAHSQDAHGDEEAASDKLDRIREIHGAGQQVEHQLLRFGLTDRTAFEVEAAAIQLLGTDELTNKVEGHHVWRRGRMTTDVAISLFDAPPAPEITERVILFRIPRLWSPEMSAEELYETTKDRWPLMGSGPVFEVCRGSYRNSSVGVPTSGKVALRIRRIWLVSRLSCPRPAAARPLDLGELVGRGISLFEVSGHGSISSVSRRGIRHSGLTIRQSTSCTRHAFQENIAPPCPAEQARRGRLSTVYPITWSVADGNLSSPLFKLGSGVVRHGLTMPLFGALADLVAFGDIAEAADGAGLDGVFVWDHVLSPVEGQWAIADPWIALAAAATRSRRIRIGPMVTPLPRRRLINVSQAMLSLDQLSGGRRDPRARPRQRPGPGALGLRRARRRGRAGGEADRGG